jgi:hypothetical protein
MLCESVSVAILIEWTALDGTYLLQLPSEKLGLQCVEFDIVRLAAVVNSCHNAGAADLGSRTGRSLEMTGERGFAELDFVVELFDILLERRVWDPMNCLVSDWVKHCEEECCTSRVIGLLDRVVAHIGWITVG